MIVEQLPEELVLPGLLSSPPVPQRVLHGLRHISGRVGEDDLEALLTQRPDQVRRRLGLHPACEPPVLIPDAREVDRRRGEVVRPHEPEDERPPQRLLHVLGQHRATALPRPTAFPDPELLGPVRVPPRHCADGDVRLGKVRIP
jgi:hypothetical protein